MFALILALTLSAVPDDLAAAIAKVEADKTSVAAATAAYAADLAALDAIYHSHYPVPGPAPCPVPQPTPSPQPSVHQVGIVMVGGAGCAPCLKMRPILAALATEGVTVTEVDADTPVGQGWQATATPTFISTCDGKELHRSVGTLTHDQLKTWFADTQAWVRKKYP